MKDFKKIQNALTNLSIAKNMNDKRFTTERVQLIENAERLIKEFVIDNDKEKNTKKNELSVWNCLSHDGVRIAMNNVHYNHEDKVAVGTNGRVLYVSHKEYKNPEKYITRKDEPVLADVYDKYDNPIDARFPNYKSVFPKEEELLPISLISEEDITKSLEEIKLEAKLHKVKNALEHYAFCIEQPENTKEHKKFGIAAYFVQFMLQVGLDNWKLCIKDGSPWCVVKDFDNGDKLLIMVVYMEDCEDKYLFLSTSCAA